MVSITAKLTATDIATNIGTFENNAKVLIQKIFNMNFYRPMPSNYEFFFQDSKIIGHRELINADDDTIWIGLLPGETDGTREAIAAWLVKAAPTYLDTTGFTPKPLPALPPTTV